VSGALTNAACRLGWVYDDDLLDLVDSLGKFRGGFRSIVVDDRKPLLACIVRSARVVSWLSLLRLDPP